MIFDYKTSEDIDALKAYAKDAGIEFKSNIGIETLRSKIEAGLTEPVKKEVAEPVAIKKVNLMILKSESDTGSKVVPVSVNGKTWAIERGKQVLVPEFIVEVLKNAVKNIYNEAGTDYHEVPAYPFTVSAA
ncbi:MAG: hypothetical protein GQ569_09255 [Methylococcaceae bacterium]|nr:hypothetical protein [Methylococcaceae bacterium]